jgi:hypothetical protein
MRRWLSLKKELQMLKPLRPLKTTPVGKPGVSSLPDSAYYITNEKARRILGCEFRSDEETFVELGKQLLEIEGRS